MHRPCWEREVVEENYVRCIVKRRLQLVGEDT